MATPDSACPPPDSIPARAPAGMKGALYTVWSLEAATMSLAEATKKLIAETGQKPLGVGVGCPGLIDPKSGMVKKSPNLPNLPHFPLRERLQSLLGLDVEIQNDANAAALGEFLFGPSKGINNLILLTLGTGVGGGIVADGHLLQGVDNAAGELGHVKVEFTNGHPCACGKTGCLEAYAGAAGIARIANDVGAAVGTTSAAGATHFDTHVLADAAKAGDAAAKKTFFIVGQYLGRAIANLIDTFNPEKVVIGGGASATMELLRPGIHQAVDEYASFPETLSRVQIERSAFPDDINVIGAAATWLNAHRNSHSP